MSTQTNDVNDIDPIETQEWLDALSSGLETEGTERAHFLLEQLLEHARQNSIHQAKRHIAVVDRKSVV